MCSCLLDMVSNIGGHFCSCRCKERETAAVVFEGALPAGTRGDDLVVKKSWALNVTGVARKWRIFACPSYTCMPFSMIQLLQ